MEVGGGGSSSPTLSMPEALREAKQLCEAGVLSHAEFNVRNCERENLTGQGDHHGDDEIYSSCRADPVTPHHWSGVSPSDRCVNIPNSQPRALGYNFHGLGVRPRSPGPVPFTPHSARPIPYFGPLIWNLLCWTHHSGVVHYSSELIFLLSLQVGAGVPGRMGLAAHSHSPREGGVAERYALLTKLPSSVILCYLVPDWHNPFS